MFIHLLAGSSVFLLFAGVFNFEISRTFLFSGAFCGIVPDIISYILSREVKVDKWAHKHRDNFSHSIFLPIIIFFLLIPVGFNLAVIVSMAILTHPLLDLFGIGWGVKLFYPFGNKTYKMFYKGKILLIWNNKEVDEEAVRFGDDNWITNIYLKPNFIGTTEWLSLASFLLIISRY